MTREDRFLIITGLSGSGKTVVSRFLEDLGYYCVDNLPATLIPIFINLWRRRELAIEKVALVVDIREHGWTLSTFPRIWEDIRKKAGPKLIFLDAPDETLVKRFSESRRPHPLTRKRSVLEGASASNSAAWQDQEDGRRGHRYVADVHRPVKETLARRFERRKRPRPCQVLVVSFGYKYGVPLEADLIFRHPASCPTLLRRGSADRGRQEPQGRDFVLGAAETGGPSFSELNRFLAFLMPTLLRPRAEPAGDRHRLHALEAPLRGRRRGPVKDAFGP